MQRLCLLQRPMVYDGNGQPRPRHRARLCAFHPGAAVDPCDGAAAGKEGWYLVFAVTFSDVLFFATSEKWFRLNTRECRLEPFPYRVTHWMPLPEPPESEDDA